ncbi:hypothetical protein ACFRI7_03440 [Streptomyces sp. NPDC056716]|uniref:hypothetical protein n=1 Tax=unclassified Streptomyces TaxID=2593676 RepID=UPI0036BBDDBC
MAIHPAGPTTYRTPATGLRPNGYALLHGHPARISTVSIDREAVRLTGVCIFTHTPYEATYRPDASVEVPVVTRTQYLLRDITDGRLSLVVETTGEAKADIPLPDGPLGEEITDAFAAGGQLYVTLTAALGQEGVSGYRAQGPAS